MPNPLSTGDFAPALEALLGPEASGLSPSTIDRLRATWSADYEQFCKRDLSDVDFVYVWADGIHFKIRLEEDRLCALVLVGVRADGTKELIAISDEPPGRFRGKERLNWLTDEAIAHDPSLNFLRDKEILDVVEHRLAVSGEVSSIRIASNGICFPANPSASTCSVISRSIWMLQRKY